MTISVRGTDTIEKHSTKPTIAGNPSEHTISPPPTHQWLLFVIWSICDPLMEPYRFLIRIL